MDQSIGLRAYPAFRITAGMVIGSLGPAFLQIGRGLGTGGAEYVIGSLVVWIVSVFFGLIVALEGVIVLIERSVEAAQSQVRHQQST